LRELRPDHRAASTKTYAVTIPEKIPEGNRNNTLASAAGRMRRRGMSPDAIEAALIVENHKRCDPPLPDGEVRTIALSVARYQPAPSTDGSERDRPAHTNSEPNRPLDPEHEAAAGKGEPDNTLPDPQCVLEMLTHTVTEQGCAAAIRAAM